MKKRLDLTLVDRNLVKTRAKAQALIMAGKVKVNSALKTKAGFGVQDSDKISIIENTCPYVSRGGLKLEYALKHFAINPKNRVCLDVGACTGGFSDCFLKSGAKLVYAIDVGKGQLDSNLAKNPNLKFIPHTNARYLKTDMFEPKPTIVAIDVSFISLKLVLLSVIKTLQIPADIIALIKPQFELEPKKVPKGVVKNELYRKQAIENLQNYLQQDAPKEIHPVIAKSKGIIPSPIKGAKGNIEYLWWIKTHK